MAGRLDLPVYQKGLTKCQNYICLFQGGASYRTGTLLVNYTRLNQNAVFIPFQFSDQQSYLIEATDLKFRFYKDNAAVTETPKTISAMTNANPGVFTSTAHGFNDGDEVFLDMLTGTSGLSGRSYLVDNSTANTFELTTVFGVAVDTTNSGTYTGALGTAARIYEIDSPYVEEHLPFLQYAQNADTMYITHQEYEPGKLTRTTHTNWTLDNSYTRTADFIMDENDYPRAVAFIDSARLAFGGTKRKPETVYTSKSPDPGNGDTRFDNFQDGINPDDAIIFTLAPLHGKTDAIAWLSSTSKFLAAGTFSSIRRIYGATEEEPISPTSLTAKSINTFGCAYTLPISDGENLYYIQRGGTSLRSLDFDIQIDGYTTTDRHLVADHLVRSGLKHAVYQQSNPDIIWCVRNDGLLIGLTFKEKEDLSGWHRHYIAGQHINDNGLTMDNARVLWAGVMPRPDLTDQLWLIVEREIEEYGTVRTVEYFADAPRYPLREDYYSGEDGEPNNDNLDADNVNYKNALFEFQKDAIHLDMAVQYNGTELGVDSLETAKTISAATNADPGVFTVNAHGYSNDDLVYLTALAGGTWSTLNNQYYTLDNVTANTFTLIGNDVVEGGKPRGKKKKKKKKDGVQVPAVVPVDTTGLGAYTGNSGSVARVGVFITPSAATGNGITITATGPIFTASMVGRELWKSYDINGDGGGRILITGFTNSTTVTGNVLVALDNASQIPPGGWLITTDTVTGVEHLEGETVGVLSDGGPHPAVTVENGQVVLTGQASIIAVGYGPYVGHISTLNLDAGGVTGSAQAKLRNINEIAIRFLNTVGTKFGTNPYRLQSMPFERDQYSRPMPLFTGQLFKTVLDRWQEASKQVHIVHNVPTPSTVLSMDIFMDTSDQ